MLMACLFGDRSGDLEPLRWTLAGFLDSRLSSEELDENELEFNRRIECNRRIESKVEPYFAWYFHKESARKPCCLKPKRLQLFSLQWARRVRVRMG